MGLGPRTPDKMTASGRWLRSSLRVLTLTTLVLGLLIVALEFGTIAEKEKKIQVEKVREQSLRRLLRQHGAEIQASINKNLEWFMRYLSRLRRSIKTGLPMKAASDDDDDDFVDPSHIKLVEDKALEGMTHVRAVNSGSDVANGIESHGEDVEEHEEKVAGPLVDGAGATKVEKEKKKKKKEKKKKHGSSKGSNFTLSALNNMDMPMHKVHGKMEPCLELLPVEEIASLVLPPPSPSPLVKKLRYYVLDDDAIEIERMAGTRLGQRGRSVELDLFWGRQTMAQRAESYKVKESMEVHCGFAAPDSGFRMTAEDREYLNGCQVAVVTASFGGGDFFAQPIGIAKASLEKACFVAFWDESTEQLQAENGVHIDPKTRSVGLWRVVLVADLPFMDQRLNGKIPKILPHRLLPNARFSIWVDSKYQFRRDPIALLEALLWQQQGKQGRVEFAISEHGRRKCTYMEGEAVVMKHKAGPEEVAVQMNQYRTEGLPVNATFDGRMALAEASIIIREHTPATNLFMCCWFNEMVRFTSRDQLSFVHVLRRLGVVHPKFFTTCMRKAMVNKLGHLRKAPRLQGHAE